MTMGMTRTIGMWAVAAALLPLAGCLEIAVKTKVDADGSSERTVSVKRPTKTLPEHGFPVPSDPSWSAEWKETADKDQPFEYTATKRFATPEELEAEYSRAPDSNALSISVSIRRSFEWFYTYVDYRETYTLRNPFRRVPARTFFTEDELTRIALGESSDSLNMKIEEWDSRNVFEEGYARLTDAVGEGDAEVNRATLGAAKEEVFRLVREDTTKNEKDLLPSMLRIFGTILHAKSIGRYDQAFSNTMAEVDSMENLRKSADSWVSTVAMPGMLVSSNGETIEGSEVRWKIASKQLLVTSVFMGARSRVTNAWAFAVTGGGALLLLVPAVLGLLRRRRRP